MRNLCSIILYVFLLLPIQSFAQCFGEISTSKTTEQPNNIIIPDCSEVEVCITIFNPCSVTNVYAISVTDQMDFYDIVDAGPFADESNSLTPLNMVNNEASVASGSTENFCFSLIFSPDLNGPEGSNVAAFVTVSLPALNESIGQTTLFSTPFDTSIDGSVSPVLLSNIIGNQLLDECQACVQEGCAENPLQDVIISGTLIIDHDYCFKGLQGNRTRIILNPDAKIIVNSGVRLTLRDADIMSCGGDRWDRIEVMSGGRLFATNSLIKGGEKAIYASGNASLAFKGNRFISNKVSITIPPASTGNVNNVDLIYMIGNLFSVDDDYDDGSISIASPVVPSAGIIINDQESLWSIGGSSLLAPNIFEHMEKGIVAINSNVTSKGTWFRNLPTVYHDIWSGVVVNPSIGIQAIGTNNNDYVVKQISPYVNDLAPNFKNVDIGIEASGINLVAENNFFTEVTDGLIFKNALNHSANISNNEIRYSNVLKKRGVGIAINNVLHGPGASVKVEKNTILMSNAPESDDTDGIGIAIEGCMFYVAPQMPDGSPQPAEETSNISNNYIDLIKGGKTGIYTRNMRNGFVEENTITFSHFAEYEGVLVEAGFNNVFSCNLIERAFPASNEFTESRGILLKSTTSTTLSTNETRNMETGIHVLYMNANATIAKNTFADNRIGLQYGRKDYQGSGDFVGTGPQIQALNVWETHCENCPPPVADELGARHYGSPQAVNLDAYLVDFSDNNVLQPTSEVNSNNGLWFQNNDVLGVPSLSFYCEDEDAGSDVFGYHQLDDRMVDGDWPSLSKTPYEKATLWSMRKRLLEKYDGKPIGEIKSSELLKFLENAQMEYYGKAFSLDRNLNESLAAEKYAKEIDEIKKRRKELTRLSNEIIEQKEILANGTDNDALVKDILAQLEHLNKSYTEAFEAKKKATSMVNESIKATIKDLGSISDHTLDSKETHIEIQQIVNEVRYQTLLNTDREKQAAMVKNSKVVDIANMCPLLGGDGVYQARDLVALYNVGIVYDDERMCDELVGKRSSNFQNIERFSLSPNPTSDYLTITLQEDKVKANKETQYQIVDLMGRTIEQGSISGLQKTIKLDAYNSGIHFVSLIYPESGRSPALAFVIQ